MKKLSLVLAALLAAVPVLYASTAFRAVVTDVSGKAFIKANADAAWEKCYVSKVLDENAIIKTNNWSKVTIMLSDRSKINMKGNSQIKLNNLSDQDREVEQQKGKSIFKITKMWSGRKFQCKTPIAVCSVRGTEFAVEVGDDNAATFKVFSGLVDVNGLGGQGNVTLNPNQKIDIKENVPMGAPVPFAAGDTKEKSEMVKSAIASDAGVVVSAELSKEAIQKAAADELRLAEYQNGKTIIDAFGQRVKIEEYIVRTAPDKYKMVVLNERDNRYDYFTNEQTFNTNLPADLSVATKAWREWQDTLSLNTQTNVTEANTQPTYYPIANESAASNTTDIVAWGLTGGHMAQNANSTYTHWYNNYDFTINGISKISFQPQTGVTNVTALSDRVYTVKGYGNMTNDQFFDGVSGGWAGYNNLWSEPSGSSVKHLRADVSFGDGSTYREEYYTINDLGKVASKSDFASNGVTAYNEELVMSGSDFTGTEGKIDLCVEPQIFIDAGLISK